MSDDPASIARRLWRAWAARDKAAVLGLITDDFRFELSLPEDVLPFGGLTHGKAAASDRLQTILEQFWTLRYVGEVLQIKGNTVLGRVEYRFKHKLTGEEIEGVMRHSIEVREGRASSLSETLDIELVRAFMRLVSNSADKV